MRSFILTVALVAAPTLGHSQGLPEPTPDATAAVTPEPIAPAPAPLETFASDLQVHGFVSPGFLVTTHDNVYLAQDSNAGSFEFAEVGVNFTKPLTHDLRLGVQLFSRKLGATGNWDQRADWFYLDYRARDWLGFRAGRVKLPFGLYNDVSDIDSARVPILLPQPVYPASNRDFLLAQNGGEIYGHLGAGPLGAFSYNAYYGTIFLPTTATPGSPFVVKSLNVPYVIGGRLMWDTPLPGLRVGGSAQQLRLDTVLFYSAPTPTEVTVEIPALLTVGSVEWGWGDLLVAGEYSRWFVEAQSSDPALFPESETESERGYVMASYRVTPWLHPGVYASYYVPNVDLRKGVETRQGDIAATLRFDLNRHWLLKIEGHYMEGTADLNPALNGKPRNELAPRWGLFAVKTTAYF